MLNNRSKLPKSGFTLIELSFVILILALVASLAVVRVNGKLQKAKLQTAEADISAISAAFSGNGIAQGYLDDMSSIPGFSPAFLRIHNLLNKTNIIAVTVDNNGKSRRIWLDAYAVNNGINATPPNCASFQTFTAWNDSAGRGWRGPYIKSGTKTKNTNPARIGLFPARNDRRWANDDTFAERGFYPEGIPDEVADFAEGFGTAGEQALGDPWGNPYVIQIPPPEAFKGGSLAPDTLRLKYARIVSAGPDGILETPCYMTPALNTKGEDPQLFLRLAGRTENGETTARGDDIVFFLNREDIYEEQE
jgi:prepilin-type N-terminal cleavage/methylation domain-containing protein